MHGGDGRRADPRTRCRIGARKDDKDDKHTGPAD
jgi:hypothetical protein